MKANWVEDGNKAHFLVPELLWVSKEERKGGNGMKLVKEKFRFVFCTLHALMRWAKKEKDTKSIKDRLQLFFFSLFLSFFSDLLLLYTELSLWINILVYTILHENNLSWKWRRHYCNRHNNNISYELCSICESINQTRKLSLPPKLNWIVI